MGEDFFLSYLLSWHICPRPQDNRAEKKIGISRILALQREQLMSSSARSFETALLPFATHCTSN
jgi:hypothetical protein